MADEAGARIRTVASLFQITVSVVGFASLTYAFGAKGEQLATAQANIDTLAETINDLAKTQASSAIADARQSQALEEIQRRLSSIESRLK